jgi:hypothetical protein
MDVPALSLIAGVSRLAPVLPVRREPGSVIRGGLAAVNVEFGLSLSLK